MPLSLPSEVMLSEARLALWPLNLKIVTHFGKAMLRNGDPYLHHVQEMAESSSVRQYSYSQRSLEAFMSRRLRAIAWAAKAFDIEKQQLGRLNPEVIETKETGYIIIAETAGVLARWLEGSISDALVAASGALRAAYWLWLEDDERSMILARTVVEQAARLRTWRLKPEKAAFLEVQPTSIRDWLQAAGWRRLSILNRSLGEFAHVSMKSKWSGAREALAEIQLRDSTEGPAPLQTARGSALDEVAFVFGSELAYLARTYHGPLATAFESVLPYADIDRPEARIEEWLQRCWSHRDRSLGDADFRPQPAESEVAAQLDAEIPRICMRAAYSSRGSPRAFRAWPLAWPSPSGPLGRQRHLQGERRAEGASRAVPRSGMRSTVEAGGTGPDNVRRSGPVPVTFRPALGALAVGAVGTAWARRPLAGVPGRRARLLALGQEPAAGRLRAVGPRDPPAHRALGIVGADQVEQGIGAVRVQDRAVIPAACLIPPAAHVDLVRLAIVVAEVGQVGRLAHGVPPR